VSEKVIAIKRDRFKVCSLRIDQLGELNWFARESSGNVEAAAHAPADGRDDATTTAATNTIT